jgi:hypothetical protein
MTDAIDGVFDVISSEEHELPATVAPETKTEKPAETPKAETTPKADAKTNTEDEVESPFVGDEQDFSRNRPKETESEEPLKTETETPQAETEVDWKTTLPPAPVPYQGPTPEVDENGQLTNMTAQEYAQYIQESTKSEWRQEMYTQHVENRSLDEAEKLLPELKTDPVVRSMVQNIRIASVINGEAVDTYEAAKQVKALLSNYKTLGAQNAKTQITIQKNAAVETQGATQKKAAPNRADKLDKRLKSGDDTAFAELFDIMSEEGKI